MLRLLITRPLPDTVITAAKARFDTEVRLETTPMSKAECVASLQDYDVVLPTLGDFYTAEVFAEAGAPRCTMLANFGVGYNHIDVAAAQAAGVMVSNTPGAVTEATADIALTLILMTARRAGEGERLVRAGNWEGWHPTQLLGMHLGGKTLGVIGMGRIGQAIARKCHAAFRMKIRYASRSEKNLPFEAVRDATLTDLAGHSDVVVVAVPGGAETHHLINAEVFATMPDHALFINIARGDVVDETALINALQAGQIAGAGLDVYEHEPAVPEALMSMENVTLLPHLGTAALEVREAMGMMAVANAIAFSKGEALPNPV